MTDAEDQRREWLWARYGRPTHYDLEAAMRTLDIANGEKRSLVAFRYRDREAAEAYASANLDHWGYPTLGNYDLCDGGVVGVVDVSAAVNEMEVRLKQERARHEAEGGGPL